MNSSIFQGLADRGNRDHDMKAEEERATLGTQRVIIGGGLNPSSQHDRKVTSGVPYSMLTFLKD